MIRPQRRFGAKKGPSVLVCMNRVRKVLRYHQLLMTGRAGIPRNKTSRKAIVADAVTDLYHFASRYGIPWGEVEKLVTENLEADWEV